MPDLKKVWATETVRGHYTLNFEYESPVGVKSTSLGIFDDDDMQALLDVILNLRGSMPSSKKIMDVPAPGTVEVVGKYGAQLLTVEDACAKAAPDAGEKEGNLLTHAAEEIKALRGVVADQIEALERAYRKEQQHKGEIVELHNMRRRLQAMLAEHDADNEDTLTRKQVLEFVWAVEEAAEVIQGIGKLLRFGLHNHHPDESTTNQENLSHEIGHFQAAVNRLMRQNMLIPAAMRLGLMQKDTSKIPGLDYPVPAPGAGKTLDKEDGDARETD